MANFRFRHKNLLYSRTDNGITETEKQDALNFHFLRLFRSFISKYSLGSPNGTKEIYVYKPSLCNNISESFWKSLRAKFIPLN